MRWACCSWPSPLMTLGMSVERVELRINSSAEVVRSWWSANLCAIAYLGLVDAVAVRGVGEDGVECAGNVAPAR